MANVSFSIPIDMRTFDGYDFSKINRFAASGTTTPTLYGWNFDNAYHWAITGTGFSGGTFAPTTGTVAGWDLGYVETIYNPNDPFNPTTIDHNYWTFTGLSVPALDFYNAVQSDASTLVAYMPTMLAGDDTINGSDSADYLQGYDGNDTINGNGGNDTLVGNRGSDTLNGGGGDDTLDGGKGADSMAGGAGNDTYIVNHVSDTVFENASAGTDIVKSSVTYALGANVENLALTGSAAIDGTGNSLANILNGNDAANTLRGSGGDDVLHGRGGNDTLVGGSGNDTLDGGAGADTFLFGGNLNPSTNVDNITDFSVADDSMALSSSTFTTLTTPGTLNSANFFTGSSAHDADDRIIYNSTTGNIYYDDDGNGPDAQVLFAHVTAATALTNADFLIVS